MKFNENADVKMQAITQQSFIYFLLKQNNVVYVGKTSRGLCRTYEHLFDKDFTDIAVCYCDVDELDTLERYYISKYEPKYNKILSDNKFIRLSAARQYIREDYFKRCCNNLTHKRFLKLLNVSNIKPFVKLGLNFISKEDYQKLKNFIEDNLDDIWNKII